MIPVRVTFIGIPSTVWDSVPGDRPFAALALDAEGAQRRIRKGVNERLERRRFSQLCQYVESAALDLVEASRGESIDNRRFASASLTNVRSMSVDDSRDEPFGSAYLGVLEIRTVEEQESLNNSRLTCTILPPGQSLEEYISLLSDNGRLACLDLPVKNRELAIRVVKQVCEFLRRCTREHCGVVQTVSALLG